MFSFFVSEKLDLLEKWRDVLNSPKVIKHLKPILTQDYLANFPDMILADQEEIMSNYRYNSSHKASAAFIDKLSRMELPAVNQLMEALCENGQHSVHSFLYERLMTPGAEADNHKGIQNARGLLVFGGISSS